MIAGWKWDIGLGCVKCWKWKYPYGAFIYLCVCVREGGMDGWMEFGLLLFFLALTIVNVFCFLLLLLLLLFTFFNEGQIYHDRRRGLFMTDAIMGYLVGKRILLFLRTKMIR
jgi:hypothetical protein